MWQLAIQGRVWEAVFVLRRYVDKVSSRDRTKRLLVALRPGFTGQGQIGCILRLHGKSLQLCNVQEPMRRWVQQYAVGRKYGVRLHNRASG